MTQTPTPGSLPCQGTVTYSAYGLDQKISEIQDTLKEHEKVTAENKEFFMQGFNKLEERMAQRFTDLELKFAKIDLIIQKNENQDAITERQEKEIEELKTEVRKNRSFLDKAIGIGLALTFLVGATEVFLVHKSLQQKTTKNAPLVSTETAKGRD